MTKPRVYKIGGYWWIEQIEDLHLHYGPAGSWGHAMAIVRDLYRMDALRRYYAVGLRQP